MSGRRAASERSSIAASGAMKHEAESEAEAGGAEAQGAEGEGAESKGAEGEGAESEGARGKEEEEPSGNIYIYIYIDSTLVMIYDRGF